MIFFTVPRLSTNLVGGIVHGSNHDLSDLEDKMFVMTVTSERKCAPLATCEGGCFPNEKTTVPYFKKQRHVTNVR